MYPQNSWFSSILHHVCHYTVTFFSQIYPRTFLDTNMQPEIAPGTESKYFIEQIYPRIVLTAAYFTLK